MMFKGDWGCFPNKQICEDCTEGKIEKMSEPVQVYTACQSYPEFGIKIVIPKVGLSRSLIFQPVSMLISFKKFGITFPPF